FLGMNRGVRVNLLALKPTRSVTQHIDLYLSPAVRVNLGNPLGHARELDIPQPRKDVTGSKALRGLRLARSGARLHAHNRDKAEQVLYSLLPLGRGDLTGLRSGARLDLDESFRAIRPSPLGIQRRSA